MGLKSNDIKILLPKVHDCITVFMGSKTKSKECFEDSRNYV